MDELLTHLEEAKGLYAASGVHGEHFRGSINCLWAKLDKYLLHQQNFTTHFL